MDRDRSDERVLAWLVEEDLEDIEDPSFRADDIESDQGSEHSHHSTNTEQSSSKVFFLFNFFNKTALEDWQISSYDC